VTTSKFNEAIDAFFFGILMNPGLTFVMDGFVLPKIIKQRFKKLCR